MPRSYPTRLLAGLALLLGSLLFTTSLEANESLRLGQLKERAEKAEKRGAWLEACRCYDELARRSRHDEAAREKYQAAYHRSLRRLHLLARNSDPTYRQTIARPKLDKALDTYEEVVKTLHAAYPDRSRADLAQLFQHGLDEILFALDDPTFKKHYLNDVKPAALATFRNRVETWPVGKFLNTREMRQQVRLLVGHAAKDGLPTNGPLANALVMEFAAGPCNALDEYSSFLTPTHLALMQGPRRTIGAGLNVTSDGDYCKISRVWPAGPAHDKLLEGDRILSVGGTSVKGLTPDEIDVKLHGKADEKVEIEFERNEMKEKVELTFREIRLPGVERDVLGGDQIGWLRINYFNEDTLREVNEALRHLLSQAPIKGLILDLRGNPGGVFVSAVQVAELFLPGSGGVVSVGQSTHPDYNRTFKSESHGSVDLPLAVLVDGDTASAAEVLAAALKESRSPSRTWVMGQTTYGKGSVQCMFELKKPLFENKPAGIRLTVAKLFSPSNGPISGKGVEPTHPLEVGVDSKQKAKDHLLRWIEDVGAKMPDAEVAKPTMETPQGTPELFARMLSP